MNKVCLNFNYWKIHFAFITILLLSEIALDAAYITFTIDDMIISIYYLMS